MSSEPRPSVFLDTSVLIAAIFSPTGGAHVLLQLGGIGALRLLASQDVLAELDKSLRAKAPQRLPDMAAALALADLQVVDLPDVTTVQPCQRLLRYANDAVVLAAAVVADVDYFVTLDRQHFLDNASLTAAMDFPLGTPGDCLAWFLGEHAN